MIKIERKRIPNGAVPIPMGADGIVKEVIMKLNENIISLSNQLDTLQRAVQEIQKEVRR